MLGVNCSGMLVMCWMFFVSDMFVWFILLDMFVCVYGLLVLVLRK